MKYIIIEDEQRARNLIRTIITGYFPNAIGEQASNLSEGVQKINTFKPDVVYLDIKLPGSSGLDIGKHFPESAMNFEIIFTTAYNEFAIDAFKTSAVDFLLKPIDEEELVAATNRALGKAHNKSLSHRLELLENSLSNLSINKIALEVPYGMIFIKPQDIILFEADGMYTKVHLIDNKIELICKPLKHFVTQLKENQLFYKPHRSFLINLNYIKEIKKTDGFYIIMDSKKLVPVSRENKSSFQEMIKAVFK